MADGLVTAFILAVVALSENVRRLPPGTFVLRRDALGPWRLARTLELGTGWHLLAWCVPYVFPFALPAIPSRERGVLGLRRLVKRLESRSRRAQLDIALLRVGGLVVLATLVLGLPFAVSRWDAFGLIAGLAILGTFTLTQATLAWLAFRRVGVTRRRALGLSMKLLWPFSAPQAAVLVQEQIASGVPALAVAHMLLGEEEFLTSLRPFVYDALTKRSSGDDARLLMQLCRAPRLAAFLEAPPAMSGPGEPFCPRCATAYRAGMRECADCSGVLLAVA